MDRNRQAAIEASKTSMLRFWRWYKKTTAK